MIFKNGRIWTMEGDIFESGCMEVKDGRIAYVGEEEKAGEAVDLKGKWVLPGFVDAHCHVGMWENGMADEGDDGNEATDPVTPHLRAIDAINPLDQSFREALEAGVTTVVTGPGSANVIGGRFVALKTHGRRVEDMIVKEPQALKIALGENPKRVYKDQEKAPATRMATAALLREAFVEAQEYQRKLELGKADPEKLPDRDLKMETLVLALERKIPVKAHAHRADDIMTALRIAREFGLDMTIEHCTEGALILDILKEEHARVILGPIICDRGKVELRHLSDGNPALFEKAGIKFALMTDHPVTPIQYLPLCALVAVRQGLSEEAALRAITIHGAEMAGIADRVGSLKVGKDADFTVFSGHPLDFRTKVIAVYVNGKLAAGEL